MSLHIESQGQGPALVLLHGWGMNGALWRPLAEALAPDYRVHRVDLPGHGRSPLDGALSLTEWAARLEQQFAEPVHVLGWSLGGELAMQWALLCPEKVRSLTLVASTPCFTAQPDWPWAMAPETLAQFSAQLLEDWRGTLKRFISLQAMGDADARRVARELTQELFTHGEPQLAALEQGLALLRDVDLRAAVAGIRCPVLLQYGERDRLTPLPAAEWLAATMPQAQLVRHAGAAHAPFLSHPAEFLAAQRTFLAAH